MWRSVGGNDAENGSTTRLSTWYDGEWPNRATLFMHGETMLRQVGDPETIMWYNGILVPISRAVGDFTFGITIDVSDEEGIAQAALEQTIRETVRQIRARAGLSVGGMG